MEAPPGRNLGTPVRTEGDYSYYQVGSDPRSPVTFKIRRGTPSAVQRAAVDTVAKAEQEFQAAVEGRQTLDEAKRRVIRIQKEVEQNAPEEVLTALRSATMAMVDNAEAKLNEKGKRKAGETYEEWNNRINEEETASDFPDYYAKRKAEREQAKERAKQSLAYLESPSAASSSTLPMFDVDDRRYLTQLRDAFRDVLRGAPKEALAEPEAFGEYIDEANKLGRFPKHARGEGAASKLHPYLQAGMYDVLNEEVPSIFVSPEEKASYAAAKARVGDLKLYWPEEFAKDEARREEQDDNDLLKEQRYYENYGAQNLSPSGRYVRTPGSHPGQPAKRSPAVMEEEAARQVAARQNLLASASTAAQRAGRLQVDTAIAENARNTRAVETEAIRAEGIHNEQLRRQQEARTQRRAFILASAEAFDKPVTEADLLGLGEAEELQLAKDMYKAIGGKGTAGFLRKPRAPNRPKTVVVVETKVVEEKKVPATKRGRGRPKKAKSVKEEALKPRAVIIKRGGKPKRAAAKKKKAAGKKGKGKGGKKKGKGGGGKKKKSKKMCAK